MPALLKNVIISTGRGTYNAGTGITTPSTTQYLTGVAVHLEPDKQANLMFAQPGSLDAYYHGWADTGTDIATGDRLLSITLLDGATNYATDGPLANTVWEVTFSEEQAAALLPSRYFRVVRKRGTGPAHG